MDGIANREPQRKKCHGNRINQRFRQKWRKRGMKWAKIENLLKKRNHTNIQQNSRTSDYMRDIGDIIDMTTMPTMNLNLNKRQRNISSQNIVSASAIPKSTSSSSISQPLRKKNRNWNTYANRRYSSSRNENTDIQLYIRKRLELLDQHYCSEAHLQLWKSFLRIGLEYQEWPDEVCAMRRTNNFHLCQQHVVKYTEDIEQQTRMYQMKINQQSAFCPIIPISFDRIDHCLKDFVESERQYLFKRNQNQLIKFKNDIDRKKLYQTINTNVFNANSLDQLMKIREHQAVIWEEQMVLEMRIFCRFLPKDFDHQENFISSIVPVTMNKERLQTIQEAKRKWL
ncbi:unnamed protein product [Adineta ricciae]|uniref:Uncharacterized protein n=1 Tax=Adineta ricciae TaxID=249248 RepID=A0A815WJ93_ADIRI|nr:unnamed protein product [Adineta ricciae]CAF1546058.1 unnamed protein product [Adineta ricciae]